MAFKPITYAALGLLQLYKWTISPLLGARCRHLPSCSDYARDAIRRFGPWRGGWLTVSRLSRCHPWGSHGFDPVPDHLPDHGWRAWRYGDWAWTERDGPASSTSKDSEQKALR